MGEDLPEIGVLFFPASARGSNTEARAKGSCGRTAPASRCAGSAIAPSSRSARRSISSASVYARTGSSDIAVQVYLKRGESMASPVKPVAIALAKAAAARAKGK